GAKPGRAFRRGGGCRNCHDTGFRGRMGVYEVMEATPDVRRLVHSAAAAHDIREMLGRRGFGNLRQEGVLLALEGKTSLDEILRVTHNEDDAHPADNAARQAAPAKGAA